MDTFRLFRPKNYQFIRESARWWLCLNFSLKIVPFYCDWLMLIAFVCPKSRIKMPFSHSVRFLKLFNCSQSMECWKCGLIALYTIIYTTAAYYDLPRSGAAAKIKTRFCSGFISQDILRVVTQVETKPNPNLLIKRRISRKYQNKSKIKYFG